MRKKRAGRWWALSRWFPMPEPRRLGVRVDSFSMAPYKKFRGLRNNDATETYVLMSQISSLLFVIRLCAHHSALRRIHASRFSSGCIPFELMQNLKSSSLRLQVAIPPYRYKDLNCDPNADGGSVLRWSYYFQTKAWHTIT